MYWDVAYPIPADKVYLDAPCTEARLSKYRKIFKYLVLKFPVHANFYAPDID
jgi:hypothetical protein